MSKLINEKILLCNGLSVQSVLLDDVYERHLSTAKSFTNASIYCCCLLGRALNTMSKDDEISDLKAT